MFLLWSDPEVRAEIFISVLVQCAVSGCFTPSTVLLLQTNINAYPFSAHNGLLRALPFTLFVFFSLQETKLNPAIKPKLTLFFVLRSTSNTFSDHSRLETPWSPPSGLLDVWADPGWPDLHTHMSQHTQSDSTTWLKALWSDTPHQVDIRLCALPNDVMTQRFYAVTDVWKWIKRSISPDLIWKIRQSVEDAHTGNRETALWTQAVLCICFMHPF